VAEVSSRKNITVYYRIQRQSLPIGIGVKPHIFWASVNSSSCFVSLQLCAPLLSPAQIFLILNCFTFLILSYMSSILLASFHFHKSLGLTWLVRHSSIHIVHYSYVHVNLPLHTRYRSFISYQHLICATIKSWIVYLSILEDGHQFVNMDLYTHYSDSQYGMDDHKSYTMFWPWHI
jgi:hypothetical protein